jgi:hypothetical protein
MFKKLLLILLFLSSCGGLGYVFSVTSMNVADKVKSLYEIEGKLIYSDDPPPIKEDPDAQWEEWDGEMPKWGVIYKATGTFDLTDFLVGNSTRKKMTILVIGLLLSLLLLFFIRRGRRKRVNQSKEAALGENIQTSENKDYKEEIIEENAHLTDIDGIRKLLLKWERKLPASKQKRTHETLSEWFQRIDGPADIIPIYEKVRYGLLECTQEEEHFVRRHLK